MAITPYNVVAPQQSLLENILSAEQDVVEGKKSTGKQMGIMKGEFEDEYTEAQKLAEKELRKKRKKKWWEKLVPIAAAIFGGPIAGGVASGLTGMYGLDKQEKHAKRQIGRARVMSKMDERWGKNFLSTPYKEQKETKRKSFDEMLRAADVSSGDLLMHGLTQGIQGYAMGKIGQSVGDAWKGAGAATAGTSTAASTGVMSGGTDAVLGDIGGTIGDIGQSVAPPGASPGDLGFSKASIPNLAESSGLPGAVQGATGQAFMKAVPGSSVIPGIGTGKMKNFFELLQKDLKGKGGAGGAGQALMDNKELLQNLLMALQYGQQQFSDEN